MRPIRIGISGKMRSGKDMLANELITHHGFMRMAFADKMRAIAEDLFEAKETPKNRWLLQELGWRLCQVDRAVWVKYLVNRMPMYRNVVVTDVRFPIEYYALRGLDFRMVRINIDTGVQMRRIEKTDPGMYPALLNDMSETALDSAWKWDLELDGAEDVSDMYDKLKLWLESVAIAEEAEK